jgi:hypothetical protein
VLHRDANGNLVRRDSLLDQLGQLLGLGNGDGVVVITTITANLNPGATQVLENPVPTVVSALPTAPPTVVPVVPNADGDGVGVTTIPIPSSLLPTTTFAEGE